MKIFLASQVTSLLHGLDLGIFRILFSHFVGEGNEGNEGSLCTSVESVTQRKLKKKTKSLNVLEAFIPRNTSSGNDREVEIFRKFQFYNMLVSEQGPRFSPNCGPGKNHKTSENIEILPTLYWG